MNVVVTDHGNVFGNANACAFQSLNHTQSDQVVSAVFCGNDLIALGVIQALESAGVRVPEDVAVVGYDDIHIASLSKPALTTVRQPLKEMGRTLVEKLLSLIETGHVFEQPRHLVFPMELVIRDSCGAGKSTQVKEAYR